MNNPTNPSNPQSTSGLPPASQTVPPLPAPPDANLGFLLDSLLKRPAELVQEICVSKSSRYCVLLALVSLFAFTIYGILVGTFSGGAQLLVAPAKVALGAFLSAAICFPSLYIFASLTGAHVSLRGMLGVLFAMLSLTGLLLLGFAPVAWVFSQSTESIPFIGALFLAIWFIATFFGLRLLRLAVRSTPRADAVHLRVWAFIFILVCLQMTTALRPMIGASPLLLPKEKKFFVSYWVENVFKN